jgi:photosystem II stability/assembly factor-like uncharacterized protein
MTRRPYALLISAGLAVALVPVAIGQDVPSLSPISEPLFKNFKARSIGPAVMGGRISDIALDPRNPHTFYVGLATGGIVKTANDGITFDSIFDKQPMLSIGALALAPSNPDVLWVGTGEANDRNSSGWGNGVYRSTDGGENWQHLGLESSRVINRIVVHPQNPDIAYVAAVGDLWIESDERGLYKTVDGGKTWKNILQAPAPHASQTGCGDVAIDPNAPDTIYAALYARRRTPWSFTYGPAASGGDDVGGIFKSTDAGATWKKLTAGLPAQTGRIGLAVSASNPRVVMAVVQSDANGPSNFVDIHSLAGGVFRSEDAGEHWTRMNDIDPRPFYFSQIRIDPGNDQRVYVLGMAMLASDDGGKTFREDLFEKVHPDCHALVIQPGSVPPLPAVKPGDKDKPPKPPINARLLLGTDGGVYQSFEAGRNWDHVNRFVAGQYYRVEADDSRPFYRIAGGLQDNSNFVGASATNRKDGIVNEDWTGLTGADGFYTVFDPEDQEVVYAEAQEGIIFRVNLRTGEGKELHPAPAEGQMRYRFGWNSPFLASRQHKGVLYMAGNRVFKLTGRGEHSAVISPDLTKNDPTKTVSVGSGAENYGVIYSLAESPVKEDLLWAGTDDGRLWVTENEGAEWTELTDNVPAPAHGQWVHRIEPGKDPKVAYAVFSAYRLGDDCPLIYRTADLGKTWQPIMGQGLPPNEPVQVVREDPENPRLLYCGTETGLFASFDQGGHWIKVGALPAVEVDDLKIQSPTADLIIATHGLSLYVLDDTRPFRELTPEVAAQPAHLFSVRPVEGAYRLPGFEDWNGKGNYAGANPAEGALFTVWVKEFTGDEIKLKVSNAAGQTVANLKTPGAPGLNRLSWDLRPTPDVLVKYGGDDPKKLVPTGDYTVELSFGETKAKQSFHATVANGIEARSAGDDARAKGR